MIRLLERVLAWLKARRERKEARLAERVAKQIGREVRPTPKVVCDLCDRPIRGEEPVAMYIEPRDLTVELPKDRGVNRGKLVKKTIPLAFGDGGYGWAHAKCMLILYRAINMMALREGGSGADLTMDDLQLPTARDLEPVPGKSVQAPKPAPVPEKKQEVTEVRVTAETAVARKPSEVNLTADELPVPDPEAEIDPEDEAVTEDPASVESDFDEDLYKEVVETKAERRERKKK